jgi:nucleoside-diphosphate-sugar epimerase
VKPTFDSLLGSTVNILTAAAEVGCCQRIVVPGSLTEPAPDQADVPPSSPYAAAKWAASAYARMFHSMYRTPVVIARAAMTYGPGQPRHRLLPHVILSVLAGEVPRLTDGRLEADWTYIDDMIDGILAAARAPDIDGLTIDLGTGTTTSARRVVELTLELMDMPLRAEFGVLPSRPHERVRAADVAVARERLGWMASTSLRDGLERTIAWFKMQEAGSMHSGLAIPLPSMNAQQSAGKEIVSGATHVSEPQPAPLSDVQQRVSPI